MATVWTWKVNYNLPWRLQYIGDARSMVSSTKESYRHGWSGASWAAEMEECGFSSTLDSRWFYYKSQMQWTCCSKTYCFPCWVSTLVFFFGEWEHLCFYVLEPCNLLFDIKGTHRIFQMKFGLWILKHCWNSWRLRSFSTWPTLQYEMAISLWGLERKSYGSTVIIMSRWQGVSTVVVANIDSLTGSGITWTSENIWEKCS